MIRANTRGRLTAADLQLVILLLSRGSAHRRAYLERRLATEGPDPLLDAPDLLERLLTVRTMLVPSEALFFYVLTRQALRGAGIDDRDLSDYLAALLLEFGQRDRAWRIDWNDDQRHRYLVDILADLEASAGDRVFFAFDRSDITPEAQQILARQADWLRRYPNVTVTIEGHCDERGTREYNLALGERRAQAVKNVLGAMGIPAARVSTISYGKERPAVPGSSEEAYAQNRRAVTTVN